MSSLSPTFQPPVLKRISFLSKTNTGLNTSCFRCLYNQNFRQKKSNVNSSINILGNKEHDLAPVFRATERQYGNACSPECNHSYSPQYLPGPLIAGLFQKAKMSTAGCHNELFEKQRHMRSTQAGPPQDIHRVFVAFGSNVGNRLQFIENAIRQLNDHGQIRVKRTSGLWETKAMYFLDQEDFLNGVCEIETDLGPLLLLDVLQAIEQSLNRVKVIEKGPRTIDLDILLYDEAVIEHERLIVPHKLMLERPFVLYPLSELLHLDYPIMLPRRVGRNFATIGECISALPKHTESNPAPSLIVPISATSMDTSPLVLRPLQPTRNTQLMSIVNLTPDSFSDGGKHPSGSSDLDTLASTILAHLRSGASIIDIGGQSSKPGAKPVSAEEEISRVVPIISHLNKLSKSSSWPFDIPKPIISIDTYRAPVARAAVLAGATIVNDISGGYLDPEMLPSIASLFHKHRKQCSVILMHMRGDPQTMSHKPHVLYPGSPDDDVSNEKCHAGLIAAIGSELAVRVQAAEAAGIPRWRILLDPGIGFSKAGEQNCELLRSLSSLRYSPLPMRPQTSRWQFQFEANLAGLPWVVGVSRKKFIGTLSDTIIPHSMQEGNFNSNMGRIMEERVWGTAAALTASIAGGADIVRVHDIAEMKRVVSVADAIWRR